MTLEQERNMMTNLYKLLTFRIALDACQATLKKKVAEKLDKEISDYDRGRFDALSELFKVVEELDNKEKHLREL